MTLNISDKFPIPVVPLVAVGRRVVNYAMTLPLEVVHPFDDAREAETTRLRRADAAVTDPTTLRWCWSWARARRETPGAPRFG